MNNFPYILNKIREEIESSESKTKLEVVALKNSAMEFFTVEMEAKQKLIDDIQVSLDSSKELTGVPHDEYFHRWARADLSKLIDTNDEFQCELLKEYLADNYCIDVDFENDCVTTAEGPCLLINHEGDILDQDSGKWVISKRDYETEEERNALIEAHMEKTGYFPSVISVDYHGNAYYVSTIVTV